MISSQTNFQESQLNSHSSFHKSNSCKVIKWGQSGEEIKFSQSKVEPVPDEEIEKPRRETEPNNERLETVLTGKQFLKKNRKDQIYILSQLKQEHEILKNIRVDEESKKEKKSLYSYKDKRSVSSSNSSASNLKANNSEKRQKQRKNRVQLDEKQQLQLIIGDNMKKLQKMLYSQMEYKKTIHELRLKLQQIQAKQEKSSSNSQLDYYKQEIERVKRINRMQVEKIGNMEGELAVRQIQLTKLLRQKQFLLKELEEERKSKEEIKLMKNTINSKELQERVSELEKIIEDENLEKISFMEELKVMTEQFDELSQNNKELQERLNSILSQEEMLKGQLEKTKYELSEAKVSNLTLSNSHSQLGNLQQKLKYYEDIQKQNQKLKQHLHHVEKRNLHAILDDEDKIRNLSRKVDEKDFQIERLKKENLFNIELNDKKAKAEIELERKAQERSDKEKEDWKRECYNLKTFYEKKEEGRKSQLEGATSELKDRLKQKEQQIQNLRQNYEHQIKSMTQRYQQQHDIILSRLESLTQSNEKFAAQSSKYMEMESKLYEEREKGKRQLFFLESLNHLWEIKETEYSNLKQILKSVENR